MSEATKQLLRMIQDRLEGSVAEKTDELLNDPEASFVATQPSNEEVGQLLPVLRARLQTSRMNQLRIFGLVGVITRLESLPVGARVLGYGIESPRGAGNIYMTERDRQTLGATIVQFGS